MLVFYAIALSTQAYAYICWYVYICIHIYICMYTYVHIYIYMYVCYAMHVCLFVQCYRRVASKLARDVTHENMKERKPAMKPPAGEQHIAAIERQAGCSQCAHVHRGGLRA